MTPTGSPRLAADALLRKGLERLRRSGPVLVPEYPLELVPRWGWDGRPPLELLSRRFEAASESYGPAIESACGLLDWARSIPREGLDRTQLCWENDWWGGVDALVQCAALKARNPARYVEIGSGYSTLFARRAINDFKLRTQLVSIDPAPRLEIEACCDVIIREPLQHVSSTVIEQLSAGDVILLDGSHVALMSTDATVFLLELLPSLPAGVLVGMDDVFLPWDYPPQWAPRVYGEQYLLAAFLLGGAGGFSVRFPGWWVSRCSPLGERLTPLWPVIENRFGRSASSLWLEREPV
jgi:hypothetical protein